MTTISNERAQATTGKIINIVRKVFLYDLFMDYRSVSATNRLTQQEIDRLEQYCAEAMGHYYTDDVILTFIENSFEYNGFESIFEYDGCEEVMEFNETYSSEWCRLISDWVDAHHPA